MIITQGSGTAMKFEISSWDTCLGFRQQEIGFTEVVLVGYGGAVGAVLHDQVLV